MSPAGLRYKHVGIIHVSNICFIHTQLLVKKHLTRWGRDALRHFDLLNVSSLKQSLLCPAEVSLPLLWQVPGGAMTTRLPLRCSPWL